VAGIGGEAKPQVGFVAVVTVAALLVIGRRTPLRSGWAVAGAAAAIVIVAPYCGLAAVAGWPS
jgi:hypothetical protein